MIVFIILKPLIKVCMANENYYNPFIQKPPSFVSEKNSDD